jgi:hypothetical protein
MNNKQRMMGAEVAQAVIGDRFALEIGRRLRKGIDLKDSWDDHIEHVIRFVIGQVPLSVVSPSPETKTYAKWEEFIEQYARLRYRRTIDVLFLALEDHT